VYGFDGERQVFQSSFVFFFGPMFWKKLTWDNRQKGIVVGSGEDRCFDRWKFVVAEGEGEGEKDARVERKGEGGESAMDSE
jgi:hypothetical protein